MSQATARLTLGSLFGTVVTAAETITGVLDTVSNGVGMLNSYVENAACEQQARILNDKARFQKQLVIEGAQAETEMEIGALSYRKKSADHAELFDQAYEKYAKIHGLNTQPHLKVAAE